MQIDAKTMQVGQVVSIKGKKRLQLVIFCELHESPAYDGSYYVYQFQTIDFKPPINNEKMVINDPTVRHFYINGYSMYGEGNPLSWSDITFVKQTKFKKETSVAFIY